MITKEEGWNVVVNNFRQSWRKALREIFIFFSFYFYSFNPETLNSSCFSFFFVSLSNGRSMTELITLNKNNWFVWRGLKNFLLPDFIFYVHIFFRRSVSTFAQLGCFFSLYRASPPHHRIWRAVSNSSSSLFFLIIQSSGVKPNFWISKLTEGAEDFQGFLAVIICTI